MAIKNHTQNEVDEELVRQSVLRQLPDNLNKPFCIICGTFGTPLLCILKGTARACEEQINKTEAIGNYPKIGATEEKVIVTNNARKLSESTNLSVEEAEGLMEKMEACEPNEGD